MTANDHRWLPMTTNDCRWLLLTTDGCRWSPIASDDHRWPPMTADEHRWLPMITDDCWWPPMTADDHRWLLMITDVFRWPPMASDNHRWLPMHTDGCRWLVTTTDGCRWPADVHRCLLMTTNENWWCECLLILRLKFCLSIPRCALMHRCFDVISQIPCFWLQDTPKIKESCAYRSHHATLEVWLPGRGGRSPKIWWSRDQPSQFLRKVKYSTATNFWAHGKVKKST